MRCFNVYLLREGTGLVAFDSGSRAMGRPIKELLGPRLKKIVLGHGHADHRGGAAMLDVPVHCHPNEVIDVQGDGGKRYFGPGGEGFFGVHGMPLPFARIWLPLGMGHFDGGPVEVEGTVVEGDGVADFEVIELPGHSPGSIGLWRHADRLAITSDCFYTFGFSAPPKGEPRVPTEHYNYDTGQAKASIRKLAELRPRAAWPGHVDPVLGDVRERLLRAADMESACGTPSVNACVG